MVGNCRSALGSMVLAALVLGGCASSTKPGAAVPCQTGCLGLATIGEQAIVGANELPLALFRQPSAQQPSEGAASFRAIFAPDPLPASFNPIEVQVERIQGGRVVGASGHKQIRFEYLARVKFDRPGPWRMEVRVRAPWQVEEAVTTLRFEVVEKRSLPNPA